MTALLPVLGALAAMGEFTTHAMIFRWAGLVLSAIGWSVWMLAILQARRTPVVVMLRCPVCLFEGDRTGYDAHSCERERRAA